MKNGFAYPQPGYLTIICHFLWHDSLMNACYNIRETSILFFGYWVC